MSSLRISASTNQQPSPESTSGLARVYDHPQLRIDANAAVAKATLADGRVLFVSGWLLGVRNNDGTTASGLAGLIAALNAGDTSALARLEGRCVTILVNEPGLFVKTHADEVLMVEHL